MLNAPVDCCCSFSKISCSSLGSLGGEGPGFQGDLVGARDEKGRRKKPGRTVRVTLMACCILRSLLVLKMVENGAPTSLNSFVDCGGSRETDTGQA